MTSEPTAVGFVGLGTMGFPMAANLISKLPKGSKMYVYDISAASVTKFEAQHPQQVVPCNSAKEVTEKSVSGSQVSTLAHPDRRQDSSCC